ncbi:protein of unknown function (plasmid) [Caballeronia sp. S22]
MFGRFRAGRISDRTRRAIWWDRIGFAVWRQGRIWIHIRRVHLSVQVVIEIHRVTLSTSMAFRRA